MEPSENAVTCFISEWPHLTVPDDGYGIIHFVSEFACLNTQETAGWTNN